MIVWSSGLVVRVAPPDRTGARHGYETMTFACRLAHGEAGETLRFFLRHLG